MNILNKSNKRKKIDEKEPTYKITTKNETLICLVERLMQGENIVKNLVINEFQISEKAFQRYIHNLRAHYKNNSYGEIIYDRKNNCYKLISTADNFTKREIFAICKILIESRAFNKQEFNQIISKLLKLCELSARKSVEKIISNEKFNYLELQHGKPIIEMLWTLAECVLEQYIVEIIYVRADGVVRNHKIKPVGIMFSEFYFYLIAYMDDNEKKYPTVFRVDRITELNITETRFQVPYKSKFSESEFSKRVQFMNPGELRIVRFKFTGVLEALLDRLPTAIIQEKTEDGFIIRAESYGEGINMWLRAQGDKVKML